MADALEQIYPTLTQDAASLARSVRTRVAALPPALGLRELVEQRAGRTEVAFLSHGEELARLLLRPQALPRIAFGAEEPAEIAGLASATEAAARVRRLAEARTARLPQLDLFGR